MGIDPKSFMCQCGQPIQVSDWQRLRMLIFGDITITCSRCQSRLTFRLIHHTVKVGTMVNKDRISLWRRP